MKKIFFIITVLSLNILHAQEPLSMEQYKAKVIGYSQEIKKAKENVVSASEQVLSAKSNLLPKIDAAAEFSYMVKTISFQLDQTKLSLKPYNYGVSFTAAQNVYSGGAVKKQIELYKTSENIAKEAEVLTLENIIYAAEMSYWNTSAMISYKNVAMQYLDIVKSTYDIVGKRFKDGFISKTDLLMVDTRIKEAAFQLSEVEKAYKQSVINMNILMGYNPNDNVNISDSILLTSAILPSKSSVEDVLVNKPQYRVALNTIKMNEQKLKLTKSNYLPKIAVGVTGQYAPSSLNFTGEGIPNGIAFAQLKIPIFSGNEKKHKSAMDKSAIRNSEYEKQIVEDNINKDLSNAWSNLKETHSQLDIAKQSLDIAEESLSLNTYSYNEGLLTILDVLSAQLSWLGAYNNYITTNMNYRIALSEYNKAIGFFAK